MPRLAVAAIFGVPAMLLATWTVVAGKDLNWDLLHYHYYVAHSLLTGRFEQDYFAARTESYLNPLGYVPFYLMVEAGWHSVLVSMLLAMAHSASVGLLFMLSWGLFAHLPLHSRIGYSVLGAGLGAASAAFWATAGTSFLDPLLCVPMLGGTVLLLGARAGDGTVRALAAGALFGLAAGLKYSNAFFALAGLVLAVSIPAIGGKQRARHAAAYAIGGAAAVALVAGAWLARLGRAFGNPFFPHLNALFGSPEAPPYMLASGRFVPENLGEALTFPLTLASGQVMSYAEINAPDLRFAAAALVAVALLPLLRSRSRDASWLAAVRLWCFFLVCFGAWVATSANARYGLVVLLLVGPCCAWAVERLLPRHGQLALGALVAVQIAVCASIAPARWLVAERWSKGWFSFTVPERAQHEPALYLSVEPQAMTAVIPFLHPASAFANLQGQDAAAPGWRRLAALRESNGGRVRILGRGLRLQADGKPRADVVETSNWTLARFGYRVDTGDCFEIGWRPNDNDPLSRWANAVSVHRESRERMMSLASCALADAPRDPAEIAEERRMSEVFSRVESACPRLFQGQTAVTERVGAEWSRNYPALDARMETKNGQIVLGHWFKLRRFELGRIAEWRSPRGARPAACMESD